jgi:hypothetical protein
MIYFVERNLTVSELINNSLAGVESMILQPDTFPERVEKVLQQLGLSLKIDEPGTFKP